MSEFDRRVRWLQTASQSKFHYRVNQLLRRLLFSSLPATLYLALAGKDRIR